MKWFGFHGSLGIACAVLHVVALSLTSPPRHVVVACVATSTTLALHARSLVAHAPLRTVIAKGVVAPHREAFKRTIAMMLYVNLRICKQAGILPQRRWLYETLLLLGVAQFIPTKNLSNGNTWVFVVPMFVGASLDAFWQLLDAPTTRVTLRFLLSTQLGALCLSFAFTLAFRKILDAFWVYTWAAACVVGRFARLASGSGTLGLIASATVSATLVFFLESADHHNKATDEQARLHRATETRVTKTPGGGDKGAAPQTLRTTPKASSYLSYVRTKLATVALEDEIPVKEPSYDEIEVVVQQVLATVNDVSADLVRQWARPCLVVHKLRVDRAAEVCLNLIAFRRRWGWPLRLDDARPLEAALRVGMHWVLPGRDRFGRRVVTYRAAALSPPTRPIAELQQMMCLLLERLTLNDSCFAQDGVIFLVDLKGASINTLKYFCLADIRRGMDMLTDAFPARLRAIYAINLPRLLLPLAKLVRSFLPPKIASRLHVTHTSAAGFPSLQRDLDLKEIPTSMGGTFAAFNWDNIVDRLLEVPATAPPESWLRPAAAKQHLVPSTASLPRRRRLAAARV